MQFALAANLADLIGHVCTAFSLSQFLYSYTGSAVEQDFLEAPSMVCFIVVG